MDYFRLKPFAKSDMKVKLFNKIENDSLFVEEDPVSGAVLRCPTKNDLLPYYEVSSLLEKYIIVSLEMKNIFQSAQTDMSFRACALQCDDGKSAGYYIIKMPAFECLHEETIKRGSEIVKLVLKQNAIENNHANVFTIADILSPYLICNLEVLESLLFNHIYPFEFEKIITK